MAYYAAPYFELEHPSIETSNAWQLFKLIAAGECDVPPTFKFVAITEPNLERDKWPFIREWRITVWSRNQLALVRQRLAISYHLHTNFECTRPPGAGVDLFLEHFTETDTVKLVCLQCNVDETIWDYANDEN